MARTPAGFVSLLLCVPVQFSTGMEGGSRRANELSRSTSVPYTAVPLRASDLIKSQNKMQGNFRTRAGIRSRYSPSSTRARVLNALALCQLFHFDVCHVTIGALLRGHGPEMARCLHVWAKIMCWSLWACSRPFMYLILFIFSSSWHPEKGPHLSRFREKCTYVFLASGGPDP